MKKVVLFVITIMLVSCDSAEKDVRDYIEKNAATLVSLDIIEISEMDSVYYPLPDLYKAQTLNSEIGLIITAAWDEASDKTYRAKIDFVVDSLARDIDAVDSIFKNAERILRMKEFKPAVASYNAKGVKAKCRINGLLRTDWFYYGDDGNIIGSTIEIEGEYKNLSEAISLREKNVKHMRKYH